MYSAGSSPRMRGTHTKVTAEGLPFGIIPAYAGNTSDSSVRAHHCGDHPRVCGEHGDCLRYILACKGSSPRMRGTQCLVHFVLHLLGIIPAYAGNTLEAQCRVLQEGDHPRVCGEHLRVRYPLFPPWGSSPRMRGTPPPRIAILSAIGIIPAYAGNTRCIAASSCFYGDHPRVCGEHPRPCL